MTGVYACRPPHVPRDMKWLGLHVFLALRENIKLPPVNQPALFVLEDIIPRQLVRADADCWQRRIVMACAEW